jgi:hypothetical protein
VLSEPSVAKLTSYERCKMPTANDDDCWFTGSGASVSSERCTVGVADQSSETRLQRSAVMCDNWPMKDAWPCDVTARADFVRFNGAVLRSVWLGCACALLTIAGVPTLARAASRTRPSACLTLRVGGLTVSRARARAKRSGCRLQLRGEPVRRADIQTVSRQSARRARSGRVIVAWVNPLCPGSADAGPPAGEPSETPGPTDLVSGLYLSGGPLRFTSAPRCVSHSGIPGAGTITVTDPGTGASVAAQTVGRGQLARIALPPGKYVVVGTFAEAFAGGKQMQSRPMFVTISAGETIRQDVSISIP